ATTAAMWFNLLAMVWWTRRSPAYRSTWPLSHFEPPHWPTLAAQLRLGLPIGVTYFAETSAFGLIALLVARFGTNEVAAHQIALNFASFSFMLPMSIGVALLTRVGQSMGAGDARAARFRAWVGIGVALAFASASALFMALLNQQIAAAYTSDRAVAALAAQLLLLAALFQLTDASQVATSCAIRGYKVTRAPMVIHMLAFWGLSLPLGCVLGLAPGWLPFGPAEPMGGARFLDCAGGGADGGRSGPDSPATPCGQQPSATLKPCPPSHCRLARPLPLSQRRSRPPAPPCRQGEWCC
ncbi:MAG: hypothetical protein RL342_117, partial [Pseudomonadota bacterium]